MTSLVKVSAASSLEWKQNVLMLLCFLLDITNFLRHLCECILEVRILELKLCFRLAFVTAWK